MSIPPKAKVLLLGDSIRLSYQKRVAEILQEVAEVVGPEDNCQYSLYTLSSLNKWLDLFGRPDVVHWNNGLHDVGHNPKRFPVQIPLEMYLANLEFIIKQLLEIGSQIIWATTTPVHPLRLFVKDEFSWKNAEIDTYNKASLGLMKKYDIPVDDLHSVVKLNVENYLCEDMLHLSELGKEKCAEKVSDFIKPYLNKIQGDRFNLPR